MTITTLTSINDLWFPFTGNAPNDGTGATLRASFNDINDNTAFLQQYLIDRFPGNINLAVNGNATIGGNIVATGTISGDIQSNYVYTTQLIVDGNGGIVGNLAVGGAVTVNSVPVISSTGSWLGIATPAPTTPFGKAGDLIGMASIDANYVYYCIASYNGISKIWVRSAITTATW